MKANYLSFLLFTLVLFSCKENKESTAEPEVIQIPQEENTVVITKEQFNQAAMQLGRIQEAPFPQIVRANGYIDVPPKSKVAVSAYYGGYVKGLDLLPGQWVKKGQTLFILENPEFVQMQQDYLEAKEQLTYLESDFQRQKVLAAENISAQKNFLKAESDFKVQQARSEGLKKKLELLGLDLDRVVARDFISNVRISAPISGFITKIGAGSGSYIQATDIALEITNTDHLHLELEVFERDVHLLREDQHINFRIPGSDARVYAAEVHLIGRMIEGENRVSRVHGHLKDEKDAGQLIPGMFFEAEIETSADSAMALPEEAVVFVENEAFVLLQSNASTDEYTLEKQLIKTGRSMNGMIEVLTPMTKDQVILTKGAFNLIMEE